MKQLFLLLLIPLIVGCGGPKYDTFAQCLTDKGAIMYGTNTCQHCLDQKAMFGSSFEYVNFVNCEREPGTCIDAGVRGYPTWAVNGQFYEGTQALEQLGGAAECDLIEDA